MALMGPDGETHSYLDPQRTHADAAAPGAGQPDRGHRVGYGVGRDYVRVAPGEPLPLDKPESTLPPMTEQAERRRAQEKVDCAFDRVTVRNCIQRLLEHQPMVESQRRILVQAIGVLETLA